MTDEPTDHHHPSDHTPGPVPGSNRPSAFIALGIAFFVMGMALDDMRAFIGVGIAFLAVGVSQRRAERSQAPDSSKGVVDGD